jgi:hypothetical protein
VATGTLKILNGIFPDGTNMFAGQQLYVYSASLVNPKKILISFTAVCQGLARRTLSRQETIVHNSCLSWPDLLPAHQLQSSNQYGLYEPDLKYQHLRRPIGSSIHSNHYCWSNSDENELCDCNSDSARFRTIRNHQKLRKILPSESW